MVSDSHGNNENVRKAIEKAGKIDYMFHCGDVGVNYTEVERMAGVLTYIVAGNCDSGTGLLRENVIHVGKHKIFMVHGHMQAVLAGLNILRYKALEEGCDIALYGHTHVPFLSEAQGDGDVTILNPGSISLPRQEDRKKTFAIIEIDDNDKVSYKFDNI